MKTASPAGGEALPKIPASNVHLGSEPVDELDFALDLLRVARVGLQSGEMGSISEQDIKAAGNLVAYALDALVTIRPFIAEIEGRTRQ